MSCCRQRHAGAGDGTYGDAGGGDGSLSVARLVPQVMSGEWRLAVSVSLQGIGSQVFSFAVEVP